MDRAERLVLFADVVDCGGFRRAAAVREMAASVVSRRIRQLETELGVRLLERSTRGVVLTEAGEALYPHGCHVRETLRRTEQLGEHFRAGVQGRLRISAARHLGRRHLLPVIAAFRERHPRVRVELQLEDRFVDLVGEGIDLAFRITRPEDSSLACRRLADTPLVIVGAPALLERLGVPASIEALVDYPVIAYRGEQAHIDYWPYRSADGIRTVGVQPVLVLNDGEAVVEAACLGVGLALLARYTVAAELDAGRLVEVLPEVALQPFAPIYALFPSGPLLPAKTRAFLDFVAGHPELAGW
jgi:DNA-binding transcriptional LysR family regulator